MKVLSSKIKLFMLLAFVAAGIVSCTDDPIPVVEACFTVVPTENIEVGDTVFFTNCSKEAITYTWKFGDDSTSTEETPFHIYAVPGNYDVELVATNGDVVSSVTQKVSVGADLAYIINYGSYSGDKATITAFDKYADDVENGYYKTVNGVDMVSNVQYAYHFNNNIYFMGNNTDGIFWVDDKTFKQTKNAISADIIKPRYAVGQGDYLYVSCWGGNIWTDETLSYIAKVNLTTSKVEKKIPLHGGPEGLAIANNKLFAALNYKDSVAVMDLDSEAISYIETPAVSSYFVKDNNENLYVSLISTYTDFSSETGLGYINTSTNKLESTIRLDGVSTSYVNILASNDDFSKIYVMTSAYDASWNLSGAVAVFDVASKKFDSKMLVEGVSGLNGITSYNNAVFCFVSESVSGNGKAVSYTPDGTKVKEYTTGIAPFMMVSAK